MNCHEDHHCYRYSDNLPEGAEYDPNAPWLDDKEEPEEQNEDDAYEEWKERRMREEEDY